LPADHDGNVWWELDNPTRKNYLADVGHILKWATSASDHHHIPDVSTPLSQDPPFARPPAPPLSLKALTKQLPVFAFSGKAAFEPSSTE
jgi:hypothetical protein